MPKKKTTAKKKTAGKKTSSTKPSKAAFIRSQPLEMPTEELIAKAKAAGLSVDKGRIYKERSNMRKATATGQEGTASVVSAAAPKAKGRSPEKKARVLKAVAEHPNWSAVEVAEAVECSKNYVYSVWGEAKGQQPSANGTAKPKSPVTQHLDHVRALRGVILHVGIDQAKAMMDQIVKDLMV